MLLCAPSMGILDNWLPVLHAARASHPDWRIVALIPDRETLAQLDATDTAHVLADEVIDATVAPLVGGGWIETPGFLAATDAAAPRRLLPRLRTSEQRRRRTRLEQLAGPDSRLLYDIHLHEKARLAPVLEAMGDTPRYSHNHGLILEEVGEREVKLADDRLEERIYTYASLEEPAYASNFGLQSDRITSVGIVRHDPAWIDLVVEHSARHHTVPFDEYVFVISRPAGTPYLPQERKAASLRALREVFWGEHGLPLVLRTHPKEAEDGSFLKGLPPGEEGVSWAISRAHPFHLGRGCRAAVAFFSGVVIDMVRVGAPTLELLDVRDIEEYDHPGAERDARGRPRFGPYREHELVIAVDDEDDLRRSAAHVLSDPLGAARPLQERYAELFGGVPLAASTIVANLADPGRCSE